MSKNDTTTIDDLVPNDAVVASPEYIFALVGTAQRDLARLSESFAQVNHALAATTLAMRCLQMVIDNQKEQERIASRAAVGLGPTRKHAVGACGYIGEHHLACTVDWCSWLSRRVNNDSH